jgi:hypothetical protein
VAGELGYPLPRERFLAGSKVINQLPLRDRLWLFFGLGIAVSGAGIWATLAGKGPIVVLVFIVAAAFLLRGSLDLARAWRKRNDR